MHWISSCRIFVQVTRNVVSKFHNLRYSNKLIGEYATSNIKSKVVYHFLSHQRLISCLLHLLELVGITLLLLQKSQLRPSKTVLQLWLCLFTGSRCCSIMGQKKFHPSHQVQFCSVTTITLQERTVVELIRNSRSTQQARWFWHTHWKSLCLVYQVAHRYQAKDNKTKKSVTLNMVARLLGRK